MAKTASKLSAYRVLAFNTETNTGEEMTLSASDAVIDAIDPEITPDNNTVERQGTTPGPRSGVPGAPTGSIKFSAMLTGSGSETPPRLANVLACCGLKLAAGVLTPLAATEVGDTGTFGLYKAGRYHSLYGVMLDATFKGEAGKPVMIEFNGKGLRSVSGLTKWRDVAMVSPTYLPVLPPTLKDVTVTVDGTAICLPGFELALGNEVKLRQCMTAASGHLAAQVMNWKNRRITLMPEAVAYSARDWMTAYESQTVFPLSMTIGTEENNTIIITDDGLTLAEPPVDNDDGGIYRDKLVFMTSDDFEIEFEITEEA